jgi:S1-C subfamily serine protease
MVVVTEAAHEAVGYLAERREGLTVTIPQASEGSGPPKAAASQGERRASLGTMPDFSYEGTGVRVQQVMPDSAAAAAGMQAGDVIVALDGEAVTDLRSFSALLKARAPGDSVDVAIIRDGEKTEVQAVLGAR